MKYCKCCLYTCTEIMLSVFLPDDVHVCTYSGCRSIWVRTYHKCIWNILMKNVVIRKYEKTSSLFKECCRFDILCGAYYSYYHLLLMYLYINVHFLFCIAFSLFQIYMIFILLLIYHYYQIFISVLIIDNIYIWYVVLYIYDDEYMNRS